MSDTELWNDKIRKEAKKLLLRAFQPIAKQKEKKPCMEMEMDYWRRSAGISRTEHQTNQEVRNMRVPGNIMYTVTQN